MSFSKEPGASEFSLNFEENSFTLPTERVVTTPAPNNCEDWTPASSQAVGQAPTIRQAVPPIPNPPPAPQRDERQWSGTISTQASPPRTTMEPAVEPFFSAQPATNSTGSSQTQPNATPSGIFSAAPPSQPAQQQTQQSEFSLLKELQRVNGDSNPLEQPAATKEELANVLESFVRVLRSGNADMFGNIDYKDRSAEIMQMKELLLEAQETIISLLNDRVFDRARIAKLESEARLLPDLQSQATRAMGLAMRSEEVQRELSQVRSEVEKLRTSYMRQEAEGRGFWSWLVGKR